MDSLRKWPYLWAFVVGLAPELLVAYGIAAYLEEGAWDQVLAVWIFLQLIKATTGVFRTLVFFITVRFSRGARVAQTAEGYKQVGMPVIEKGVGAYYHLVGVVENAESPVDARIVAMGDLRTLEAFLRFWAFCGLQRAL